MTRPRVLSDCSRFSAWYVNDDFYSYQPELTLSMSANVRVTCMFSSLRVENPETGDIVSGLAGDLVEFLYVTYPPEDYCASLYHGHCTSGAVDREAFLRAFDKNRLDRETGADAFTANGIADAAEFGLLADILCDPDSERHDEIEDIYRQNMETYYAFYKYIGLEEEFSSGVVSALAAYTTLDPDSFLYCFHTLNHYLDREFNLPDALRYFFAQFSMI